MNDPGTAEPIDRADQETDGTFHEHDDIREIAKKEEKELLEEERDFRDPRCVPRHSVPTARTDKSLQPLLVPVDGMSSHRRHFWAYGFGVQHLCS